MYGRWWLCLIKFLVVAAYVVYGGKSRGVLHVALINIVLWSFCERCEPYFKV